MPDPAHTYRGSRPSQRARLRAVLAGAVVVFLMAWASMPDTGVGASSSSSTVAATVLSSISMSNQCGQRAAWALPSGTPGSNLLSTTGASVCRFGFSSSNSGVQLQVSQRDGTGTAMTSVPSAVTTHGIADSAGNDLEASGSTFVTSSEFDTSLTMRRSQDAGATWSTVNSGIAVNGGRGNAVSLASASIAWHGGTAGLEHSNTFGAATPTWASVSPNVAGGGVVSNISDIDAISYNTAWAIEGGTVYYTNTATSGGTPWTASGTACGSREIVGLSATSAVVAGEGGSICYTTNSNGSWTLATGVPLIAWFDITAVPGSTTNLWAVGYIGSVIRSTDGGATWTAATSVPGQPWLNHVVALSASELLVTGRDGLMYRSTDTGATWTRLYVPVGSSITDVAATDSNHIAVSGIGGDVWRTADGGTTWTSLSGGSVTDANGRDVAATDLDTVIESGSAGWIRVFSNKMAGIVDVATGLGPDNVRGVAAFGDDEWIVVGDRGAIARTDDRGVTWSRRASGTTATLWDVDISSEGVALAVGDGGTILRSTDRGLTWTTVAAAGSRLLRVQLRSNGPAIAAGADGFLRQSSDAGATWTTRVVPGLTRPIDSLTIASPTVAYAAGSFNLYKSTDGGVTWAILPAAAGRGILRVSAANEDLVWATTGYSPDWTTYAFLSTDGGATWVTPLPGGPPNILSILAFDGGKLILSGEGGHTRTTGTVTPIADWAASGWAGATSRFGVCLQGVGGTAVSGSWAPDPDTCTASDSDPWYPVPTVPTTVARLTSAGVGSADLVWGFRVGAGEAPASFTAGITVRALAP